MLKKYTAWGVYWGKFYISGKHSLPLWYILYTKRWSIQIFSNIKKIRSIAFGHSISTLWLKNWNKFFHKMLENNEGLREASVHGPLILVLFGINIQYYWCFIWRSQSVHSEGLYEYQAFWIKIQNSYLNFMAVYRSTWLTFSNTSNILFQYN